MTSTTLSPVDLSTEIMTYLKADATLVAAVGAEIREANWMGDEFAYPAVRVDLSQMDVTLLNGNCKGRWFNISFSLYVFIEGRSSLNCQTIMGILGKRFQNKVMTSAKLQTQPLDVRYMPVISDGQSLWRGEVVVVGRMRELL